MNSTKTSRNDFEEIRTCDKVHLFSSFANFSAFPLKNEDLLRKF